MDRVRLSGILADPKAARDLQAHLVKALEPEAARLEALVKSRTPVSTSKRKGQGNPPPGTLRDKIKGSVRAAKKGIVVLVKGDAAKRNPTPGDAPTRTGKVPYGVFVNNENEFFDATLLAEQGKTLEAVNKAVGEWVATKNAGPGTSPAT